VALSLVGFLTAVVGVPLPSYPGKDLTRPFPCMDRACGCPDAEHCWRHCCCFTKHEQLAWAHEHHVIPPPEFVEALADEDGHEHESTPGSVAAKSAHGACCHAGQALTKCEKPAAGPSAPPGHAMIVVLSEQFRQCHGLAPLWSVLGAATAPPTATRYCFDWLVVGWVSTRSITADSDPASPPTPPPLG